jgi:ABC-type thiamin/hydroxymethylpyrimidine transport system permease subunit
MADHPYWSRKRYFVTAITLPLRDRVLLFAVMREILSIVVVATLLVAAVVSAGARTGVGKNHFIMRRPSAGWALQCPPA